MSVTNTISEEHKDVERQLQEDIQSFLRSGGSIHQCSPVASNDHGNHPAARRMQEQSRRNSARRRLLTMDDARDIRRRFNGTKGSIVRLAREYKVRADVISGIVNGRTYKDTE